MKSQRTRDVNIRIVDNSRCSWWPVGGELQIRSDAIRPDGRILDFYCGVLLLERHEYEVVER